MTTSIAESADSTALTPDPRMRTRVLMIDDDVDLWPLVAAMLRPLGVRLSFSASARDGILRAKELPPDVILLDHLLKDGAPLDVLRELRLDPQLAGVPIVIVTGRDDPEALGALFTAGATDHLRKPLVSAELRARLTTTIERRRLLVDLSRAESVDPLTGLANRRMLLAVLQRALERHRPDVGRPTLLVLDLDRFNQVNDSVGHSAGDRVLRDVARRLRAAALMSPPEGGEARAHMLARVGGDKFALVYDRSSEGAVQEIAEHLLRVVSEPLGIEDHLFHLSASIGIVQANDDHRLAEDLLRDADIAMCAAKARGRGCHTRFDPPMRTAISQRVRVERALRAAIGTSQIEIAYQPIVSLADCHLESVEALVRWEHPELGRIMPDDFIPMAEETRLIVPLAESLLRRSCADFMTWHATFPGAAPRTLSVNLSRVELTDDSLPDRVLAIMTEVGMPPSQLQLEVTESQLMEHRGRARAILERLRHMRVKLAMDDFGTGYSSLACLQELPFDVLKVDRGFTRQIVNGGNGATLLRSVMSIASHFGFKVVAEGVELAEEVAFLQAIGCHFGQGYLIGRPMPAPQLQEWWSGEARPCGAREILGAGRRSAASGG